MHFRAATPNSNHNHTIEDENDTDAGNDNLVSVKELKKKDIELKQLLDVNKKLEEAIKIKDDTNDALTAAKNSLDEVIRNQTLKINKLEVVRSEN